MHFARALFSTSLTLGASPSLVALYPGLCSLPGLFSTTAAAASSCSPFTNNFVPKLKRYDPLWYFIGVIACSSALDELKSTTKSKPFSASSYFHSIEREVRKFDSISHWLHLAKPSYSWLLLLLCCCCSRFAHFKAILVAIFAAITWTSQKPREPYFGSNSNSNHNQYNNNSNYNDAALRFIVRFWFSLGSRNSQNYLHHLLLSPSRRPATDSCASVRASAEPSSSNCTVCLSVCQL